MMTLDVTSRDDVNWWIAHLDSEFAYIKTPEPSVTLCTAIESDFHINYLELLAVLNALKSFFKTEHGLHIRICSNNSCAVAYVNHMGGTHS